MAESDPENDRRLQLECLRLASDLTQLAKDSPDPDVRANALRMAKEWTDKAELGPPYDDATRDFLS